MTTATAFAMPAAAAAGTVVRFAPDRMAFQQAGLAPARMVAQVHVSTLYRHNGFNINGFNWGGYAASGSGFTSAAATWVEPAATCHSTNDLYAPWVGLDGYGSSTVEQTGIATDCSSGSPVNEPWYEMYPANPVYLNTGTHPVSTGDTVSASVTYNGSAFVLVLRNVTRGWTFTVTKTLRSARRLSAEVIIESPTASYPNFGTIHFTAATVNGATLGSFNPVAMDPSNSHGTFEAHTSALTGGNAFSITFQHE